MAIRTDEDLEKVIASVIKDVVISVSERAKKLLQQHINADTYGIGKNVTGHPRINRSYLNDTGTPSYEFRDVAWNIKFQNTKLFSIFFYYFNKFFNTISSATFLILFILRTYSI